jgi:hypothetical protein
MKLWISSVMCGITCTVRAEVLAAALLLDHRLVDLAGGEVVAAGACAALMKRS